MGAATDIALITGGARSGKSALAERLVLRHDLPRIYIATAQAGDAEMSERIKRHQERRGESWTTLEEPFALSQALCETDGLGVRLIDCLTLWLANGATSPMIDELTMTLRQQTTPVVLVTNELGQGIVPDSEMTRKFRDEHGWMNQAVAEVASEVWMSVSGQPLRLKPSAENLHESL